MRAAPRYPNGRQRCRETSRSGLTVSLSSPLHAADQSSNRHPQGVTKAEEDIHRRRFLVVFQLRDVGAVEVRLKRKLFLREPRRLTCLPKFSPQHASTVTYRRLLVR